MHPVDSPAVAVAYTGTARRMGNLRGTIILGDEQHALPSAIRRSRSPARRGLDPCAPQYVRMFRGVNARRRRRSIRAVSGPDAGADIARPSRRHLISSPSQSDQRGGLRRLDRPRRDAAGAAATKALRAIRAPTSSPTASTARAPATSTSTARTRTRTSTGDNVSSKCARRRGARRARADRSTPEKRAAAFDEFFDECEERLRGRRLSQWPRDLGRPAARPYTHGRSTLRGRARAAVQAYDADIGSRASGRERSSYIDSDRMAAVLHRRLSRTASLLPQYTTARGRRLRAAVAAHGSVAGHALVSRAQARLDRDQRRPTA